MNHCYNVCPILPKGLPIVLGLFDSAINKRKDEIFRDNEIFDSESLHSMDRVGMMKRIGIDDVIVAAPNAPRTKVIAQEESFMNLL